MSDPFSTPSKFKQGPQKPPRLAGRPPRERRPAIFGRGPNILRRSNVIHTGGPGEPPPGFLSATTSRDEWFIYWALMRVLDPNQDPRQPPFYGGKDWAYQSSELGTYVRELGSAVVDFLITLSYPFIVLRIQTYRFHLATDAKKQAYDALQLTQLSNKFIVVDIYSQDYIADPTGEAAVIVVKESLAMIRRQNPLTASSTLMVRPERSYG